VIENGRAHEQAPDAAIAPEAHERVAVRDDRVAELARKIATRDRSAHPEATRRSPEQMLIAYPRRIELYDTVALAAAQHVELAAEEGVAVDKSPVGDNPPAPRKTERDEFVEQIKIMVEIEEKRRHRVSDEDEGQ
jgi:hypothetical protein